MRGPCTASKMLINECSTHADEPTEDYSRGQMCVPVTRLCCQQGENVQAQSSISWSPDHNCTHMLDRTNATTDG